MNGRIYFILHVDERFGGKIIDVDLSKGLGYNMVMPPKKQPLRGKEPVSWWIKQVYEILKLQTRVGEVMSMTEAAQYLEVSRQRMTQLCKSGRIRHWKFGRKGVVTKAEVVAYAKEVQSGKLVGGRGHKAKPVLH